MNVSTLSTATLETKPTHSMNMPLRSPTLRRCVGLLLVTLGLAAIPGRAANSAPPELLSYQGYLTDGSGVPLGSTNTGPKNYNVVFRIWDLPNGGSLGSADELYSEQQTLVVNNGYFSVLLGQGSAYSTEPHGAALSPLFYSTNTNPLYVETVVLGIGPSGGNITIAPRLQLLSSPYAFLADNALNAANAANALNAASAVNAANATNAVYAQTTGTALTANQAFNLADAGGNAIVTIQSNPAYPSDTVGIYNNSPDPTSLLDVGGQLQVEGNGTIDSTGSKNNANGMIQTYYGDNNRYGMANLSGGILALYYSSIVTGSIQFGPMGANGAFNSQMTVNYNGYVGIGTTSPNYPLDIETYKAVSYSNFQNYESLSLGGAGVQTPGPGIGTISLYASGRIVCNSELDVISDARVKEIVDRSDPRDDLATVRKLQITDYRKLDRVQFGGRLEKGVIAQEVETVIPGAVSTSTNFIPNIYALPQSFTCTNQTLVVTMAKPHGLAVGDVVKLITDTGELKAVVAGVKSPTVFTVGEVKESPAHVFVFGKQVGDFREVNYDRLFTTGLGAIQELAKRSDDLDARETRLAKRVDELDAREARLATVQKQADQVAALEQEVSDLKKLVAQLADAQKNSKLTAGAEAGAKTLTTASLDR